MLQWAWETARRQPTRVLMFVGLAILVGVAIHLHLLQRLVDPHSPSPLVIDVAISAAIGDMLAALVGLALMMSAAWRILRGKP